MSLDFTFHELTNAINIIPNMFGRVGQLAIFRTKGITTTVITVEEKTGTLSLVPSKARGSDEKNVNRRPSRRLLNFNIPHFPLDDMITASDLQGVREFGTQNTLESPATKTAEVLAELANKHDITLEHLMVTALQGKVLDADGSTISDFFDEFGVTRKTVDFKFGTDSPAQRCRDITRFIKLNLKGESMSSIRAFVSPGWFDEFIKDTEVVEAYKFFRDNQGRNVNAEDVSRGFEYHGVTFEEYIGSADFIKGDGTVEVRDFVPEDEGFAFPLGTRDTFWVYYAPGDLFEAANTVGLPRYAFQERRIDHKGIDIHTETNPFPIMKRPILSVKITKSV